MNRRQFLCGVAAAALVAPAAQASTQVNPDLAKMAADFHVWYEKAAMDSVKRAVEYHWFLCRHGEPSLLKHMTVKSPSRTVSGIATIYPEWSTADLKYPPMCAPASSRPT